MASYNGDYPLQPVLTNTSIRSDRTDHTMDTSDSKNFYHARHVENPPLSPTSSTHPVIKNYEQDVENQKTQAEDVEPKMSFTRAMALISMAFLWSGSQIPLYLFGTCITTIVDDIGGQDRYAWILLANLIPLSAVTPFVGAFSDLFGRKWVAVTGAIFLVIGSAVCGIAKTMNIMIGGQTLVGVGAGINELTALAVAAELAPKNQRGVYIGAMVFTILPFCPAGLYSQLVAVSSWRWLGLWSALWSFIGMVLCIIFFRPPPRQMTSSRMEIAKSMDWVGGLLSTAGVTLVLAGLTWAAGQYAWDSAHVAASLVLGSVLCVAFAVWEIWGTKHPMFPRELGENPKALTLILIMTFCSGANFLGVLGFWTTEYVVVYGDYGNAVHNGLGSLPVGFGIIGGSVIVSALLSAFKTQIKWIMTGSCCVMVLGAGLVSLATPDNLTQMWFPITLASLGVGAVMIPNQVIASILVPDHLLATITACTLAVRMLGAAVGYAIFYNVLKQRYSAVAVKSLAYPMIENLHIGGIPEITEICTLLASGDVRPVLDIAGVDGNVTSWNYLIDLGRTTFALSTPIVYYVSAAFGGGALICALLLPNDLGRFMTKTISVDYK